MPINAVPDRMLDLPIFHKSYEFIVALSNYIARFPKKDRYTIGAKIENASFDFLALIMRANYAPSPARVGFLNEASITLDMLKIFVRLAKDKQALQVNQYIIMQERLQEIGRQLGGWIKSTKGPA